MKKLILLISLIANIASAQISNLPAGPNITAYKENPLVVYFQWPAGVAMPTPVTAEILTGAGDILLKTSITPTITVSSLLITFSMTAEQVRRLTKNSHYRILFNGVRKLGGKIETTTGTLVPASTPYSISLPDVGTVKVNLIGPSAAAEAYAVIAAAKSDTAKTNAGIATAKAAVAVSAANSIDPKVSVRSPYGPSTRLRALPDTSYKSFYVTDKGREGTFVYNPTSTASDDSSMTIISGGRRYTRPYEYVKPEFFGAIVDDGIDDGAAIQKAFNFAGTTGVVVKFSVGTYNSNRSLVPKVIDGKTLYKIVIVGAGKGKTVIQGGSGPLLDSYNLINFNPSTSAGRSNESLIEIKDITFYAGTSDRILYLNTVIDVRIENSAFYGGDTCGVQIGDKIVENYGCYIRDCYFNGVSSNNWHNKAALRLYAARYAEVSHIVSDGSGYGIDMASDQCVITACTLEGSKVAGIYIKAGGGGSHKIFGNTIRPYTAFEPGGIFAGTLDGMRIESISGGSASNAIYGNVIYMPSVATLGTVILTGTPTGTFVPAGSSMLVTGSTSGATGYVYGNRIGENRLVLGGVTGTFTAGETITQAGSGASASISSLPVVNSNGMSLLGNGGYNSISNNQINGDATWAFKISSDGNLISNNVASSINGISTTAHTQIAGNRLYNPSGISIKNTNSDTQWNDNYYTGTLDGINPQMFSGVTTTQRNAILSPKAGLILYDTTVNKLTRYNGSAWAYIAVE